jgi:hypothetical protein
MKLYLTSTDGLALSDVRECVMLRSVKVGSRDDAYMFAVNPTIRGVDYDLDDREYGVVLLATRHVGDSILQSKVWPISVHVALIKSSVSSESDTFSKEDYVKIAWGDLFDKRVDAELHRYKE